jgi:sulfocyanin
LPPENWAAPLLRLSGIGIASRLPNFEPGAIAGVWEAKMKITTKIWRLALLVMTATVLSAGAGRYTDPSPATAAASASWMKVDGAHRHVAFTVTASQGGANGTLNFNGYANGQMTVTVPAGWAVHIDFINAGAGALPHSFEVIRNGKIPPQGVPAAIAGAVSQNLVPGIPPLQEEAFDFGAAPAGSYLWFCGVPGHGLSGMWTRFIVSATAKTSGVTLK